MNGEKALNQAMDLIADFRQSEAEEVLQGLIGDLRDGMDGTVADADRHFCWGRALYLLEEPEQALLRFEQALQILPDHEYALWEMASILLHDLDKPESAKSLLEQRLMRLRPSHPPYAEALAAAETLIRRREGRPVQDWDMGQGPGFPDP